MAYPDNLLSRGETVVLHKHPHWKVLVLPIVFFLLIVGGVAAFIAWVTHWQDSGFTTHLPWIIGAVVVGLALLVWLAIAPMLRWATEHFVISTQHVFFRTGILSRREHQIPLSRIQNMETEVSFWGRLLGFGSLIVESAADQPLEFQNVASLPKVQATLNQLISDDRGRYVESSAGDGSAGRLTVAVSRGGDTRYDDPQLDYAEADRAMHPDDPDDLDFPQTGSRRRR